MIRELRTVRNEGRVASGQAKKKKKNVNRITLVLFLQLDATTVFKVEFLTQTLNRG